MNLLLICCSAFVGLLCSLCTPNADAWSFPLLSPAKLTVKTNSAGNGSTSPLLKSRRQLLTKSIFLTATGLSTPLLTNPTISNAASGTKSNNINSDSPQTKTDKENLIKGYKRLTYLLNNWEKETTICGRSDNPYIGCERTPEIVMDYLGFKSMNDPLFRIDKTLLRLQSLVSGTEYEIDYMDTMETINQAVEDGNGIAFVSSWGEANPGGGKDRIELFIERSKGYVVATRDGLGAIIKILDLKVDA